ncbi:MAG: winged helix-turn-helix transcriptional regulator [Anaerolineae bacterium]|nr:winged helix-turn-helix transcriptional regulator [Anaerolineae bacterium]
MPEPDFVMAPDTITTTIALEPAQNALHSLALIHKVQHMSGLDDWVTRTAAALSPEQAQRHGVVFEGLFYLIQPQRSFPSFPAYLDDLAAQPAEALRDRLLKAYHNMACETGQMAGDELPDLDVILASEAAYLQYLYDLGPFTINEEIERSTYHLLIDPPAMRRYVVDHLHMMWQEFVAPEWARVEPMLQEAVEAFATQDYAGLTPPEIARRITGHDYGDDWTHKLLSVADRVIFVPSAHIGPYMGKYLAGKTLWLLFGARLPEGVRRPASSALTRSELLVRLNALADDTRLRILALVAEHGELCAQDIITKLDLSQSAASRHLKQLSATGYLFERRQENAKCYSLNPDRIEDTCEGLRQFVQA